MLHKREGKSWWEVAENCRASLKRHRRQETEFDRAKVMRELSLQTGYSVNWLNRALRSLEFVEKIVRETDLKIEGLRSSSMSTIETIRQAPGTTDARVAADLLKAVEKGELGGRKARRLAAAMGQLPSAKAQTRKMRAFVENNLSTLLGEYSDARLLSSPHAVPQVDILCVYRDGSGKSAIAGVECKSSMKSIRASDSQFISQVAYSSLFFDKLWVISDDSELQLRELREIIHRQRFLSIGIIRMSDNNFVVFDEPTGPPPYDLRGQQAGAINLALLP
jgi:hypothetical protein